MPRISEAERLPTRVPTASTTATQLRCVALMRAKPCNAFSEVRMLSIFEFAKSRADILREEGKEIWPYQKEAIRKRTKSVCVTINFPTSTRLVPLLMASASSNKDDSGSNLQTV